MNSIYLPSLVIQLSCKIAQIVTSQLADLNPAFLLGFADMKAKLTFYNFLVFEEICKHYAIL